MKPVHMPTVVSESMSGERDLSKEKQAQKLIKDGVILSVGGGLLPVPILDLIGIAGGQTHMLRQLSELYRIPYSQHRAKNIIATLIASLGTGYVGTGLVASVVKTVPFVGSMAGVVSLPIIAGASTYALGKVFVQHFESGGTFLNFEPEKTKTYFARQFAEGKLVVGEYKEHSASVTCDNKSEEESLKGTSVSQVHSSGGDSNSAVSSHQSDVDTPSHLVEPPHPSKSSSSRKRSPKKSKGKSSSN